MRTAADPFRRVDLLHAMHGGFVGGDLTGSGFCRSGRYAPCQAGRLLVLWTDMFGSPVGVTEAVDPCPALRPGGKTRGSPLRRPRPLPSGLPIASDTWAMKMLFVLMTASRAHQRPAEDLRSKTWGSGEPGSLG
jgi:hypothetical protein